MTTNVDHPNRADKLRHELTRYAIVSLYLYICIGAIIFFKWAVLRVHDVDYMPWGIAAVKALVIGKFVLLGRSMRLGEGNRGKPLIYFVGYQVLLFAALIIALSLLEEIVKAAVHGKAMSEAFSAIAHGVWLQIVASCILLCLILTPYFGLGAISDAIGSDRMRRLFFGP